MGDTAKDPVDHARTTRPHAGETMKDTANMPALGLLFLALVSFVACLAAFGTGQHAIGIGLACLAAVLFIGSGLWLAIEHRRVKNVEQDWNAKHDGPQTQRES
ncbi:hypothetical protein EB73_26760 [Mycobacterium sp. SWH-M3]|nr:hypothetical protein EB73_26760 [Mycobacterium sp. SWH-M3]